MAVLEKPIGSDGNTQKDKHTGDDTLGVAVLLRVVLATHVHGLVLILNLVTKLQRNVVDRRAKRS